MVTPLPPASVTRSNNLMDKIKFVIRAVFISYLWSFFWSNSLIGKIVIVIVAAFVYPIIDFLFFG